MVRVDCRLTTVLGRICSVRGNEGHQPQWGLPQQPLIAVSSEETLWVKTEKMNSTLLIDHDPGPITMVSRLGRAPNLGSHARAPRIGGYLPSETEPILLVTSQV